MLLLGTSLIAFTAIPSTAYAQNECGTPPPGGGTVDCTPAGNPYTTGITYTNLVDDLTVVLEPDVVVNGGVNIGSTALDIDIGVQGATDTTISTASFGVDGAHLNTADGTVYASLDSVSTTGPFSDGIDAQSNNGITVFVHDIATTGKYSDGIRAVIAGSPTSAEGQPLVTVTSGSISTGGKYSDGIFVQNGSGAVNVDSGTIHTTGKYSDGIQVTAGSYASVTSTTITTTGDGSVGIDAFGVGGVTINSGTISTSGDDAGGIYAEAGLGSVVIDSGSVSTEGADSNGITAYAGKYGNVSITSGSVTTGGDNSIGIYAHGDNLVSVNSTTVVTTGDNAGGIIVRQGTKYTPPGPDVLSSGSPAGSAETIGVGPGVYINSGSSTTGGDHSPAVGGYSLTGFVSITSTGTAHTTGDYSEGIIAVAYGDVGVSSNIVITEGDHSGGIDTFSLTGYTNITSGSVTTSGLDSAGIDADAYLDVSINSTGTVSTAGDESIGINGYSYAGDVAITSNIVSTQGDYSDGIDGYSTNLVTITSTTVTTTGDYSAGISAGQFSPEPPPAPVSGEALIGTPPGVSITSGGVTTSGDHSPGIQAYSNDGYVEITSTGTVSTGGLQSTGINAYSYNDTHVASNVVHTTGDQSDGIDAGAKYGDVVVGSTTVTTTGDDSTGIFATAGNPLFGGGDVTVTSGSVSTIGEDSSGIVALAGIGKYSDGGNVTVTSGTVSTVGDNSAGIVGIAYDNVTIGSTTVTTQGEGSVGIYAIGLYGDVGITSGAVTTHGDDAIGIQAYAYDGNLTVASGAVTTSGDNATGILAAAAGNVTITSTGTIGTTGDYSGGISASAFGGDLDSTSATVTTAGDYSIGISAYAFDGNVTIHSTTVNTTGYVSGGISATGIFGDVAVTSGNVTTSGDYSDGINTYTYSGSITVTSTGTVRTGGYASDAIDLFAYDGDATVVSNTVVTAGDTSTGIEVQAIYGDVSISSVNATTAGANSFGIYGYSSDGSVTVASTGTVRTGGAGSDGINAAGATNVVITSNTIVTTGANANGIYATQFGAVVPPDDDEIIGGGAALGPNGGISVTSGSITTSGAGSAGMDLFAATGNIEITSTGPISTTGAGSRGIIANSLASTVTVDVGSVTTTGTGASDALFITSATGSTITIRGLVQATNGFEVQANGGAATVSTTAAGVIRGAMDLTDNADRLNNAGLFDVIGTSLFGAGTDIVANSGTVRSTNGAGVLAALEQFNNTGLVDLHDGAVGDTLNVTGAFTGSGGSHLSVDSNISNSTGDVLITGVSTGSTALDVTLVGAPVFNTTGTLVVDATAGTSSTAFTLVNGNTASPYVHLNLIFDAPNNNFLLVGLPAQPVFETVEQGEMAINFWYQSADAVSAQLEGARDGLSPTGGSTASHLAGAGRFGGWVQVFTGNVDRDTSQSFSGGGNTTVFDTSYQQDFDGIQGGLDYQNGGAVIGVTFGVGRSDAQFDQTFNQLDMDGANVGAYAAFNSGRFFANGLAKVDWINVESDPGGGTATKFDATAWGLRGVAGFRFGGDHFFFEPTVSLSWVNVDIDNYTSNGAAVSFDDITSFRGAAGIRLGARLPMGTGTLTPWAGIHAVDEFDGDVRNTFQLGQTIVIQEESPGTFGEASAGLNYSVGRLEAFIRGELDFGGDRDGLSGRAGLRLRF